MSKLCKPPCRKFKQSIQPMMKHKSFLSVKMFPKFLINSVCDSELRFKLIAIYNWLSQMKFYRTNGEIFVITKLRHLRQRFFTLLTIPLAPNPLKKLKTCYFFLDLVSFFEVLSIILTAIESLFMHNLYLTMRNIA